MWGPGFVGLGFFFCYCPNSSYLPGWGFNPGTPICAPHTPTPIPAAAWLVSPMALTPNLAVQLSASPSLGPSQAWPSAGP